MRAAITSSFALAACLVLAGEPRVAAAQQASCARATTWQTFVRCHYKRRAEVVRDLPSGKLVMFVDGSGPRRPLALIARQQGLWTVVPFHGEQGPTLEVLDARELAPDTYRIDVGFANAMSVTIDQISTRPAVLRRRYTYVCAPNRGCQQAITRCELLVHGKVIAGFRGDVVWNGTSPVLRVDLRAQHRYCMPPGHFTIEEPDR